jgi:hypothetical protein
MKSPLLVIGEDGWEWTKIDLQKNLLVPTKVSQFVSKDLSLPS